MERGISYYQQWYQLNRDYILKYGATKINCFECGKRIRRSSYSSHRKSKKHILAENILLKDYRNKHGLTETIWVSPKNRILKD